MNISVIYDMTARKGESEALGQALNHLAATIRALPGGAEVTVWADTADAARFVFIERWPSRLVYDAGASLLPAAAFAPLQPLLDSKPSRRLLVEG